MGATLATIDSSTEDSAVYALMSTTVDCYIGLNDLATEGKFVWTEDGTEPTFTNWYGTNPRTHTVQNCVVKKSKQSGKWDDVGCNKSINYACSMPAVCG